VTVEFLSSSTGNISVLIHNYQSQHIQFILFTYGFFNSISGSDYVLQIKFNLLGNIWRMFYYTVYHPTPGLEVKPLKNCHLYLMAAIKDNRDQIQILS
jgi:hypothetical protein